MFKDLLSIWEATRPIKAILPRLGRLARALLGLLLISLVFSTIGIVTVVYLLIRLAIKPLPSAKPAPAPDYSVRIQELDTRIQNLEFRLSTPASPSSKPPSTR